MPRRNRQKLHRKLRLQAEARKAERRLARLRRQEAQARHLRACREALAHKPRPQRVVRFVPAIESSVDELLQLAGVGESIRQRVRQILRVVAREIPAVATSAELGWFLLLAEPSWVRRPDGFRAPSGSTRRKRDALAEHLLVRYPVPAFLLRALDHDPLAVARVPVEDRWAVSLLASVGQGAPLRSLVNSAMLPTPLTRRMCHAFLAAPADARPVEALRFAQVEGFGGTRELARKLSRTRLGELRGPDPQVGEPFWHRIVGWLCARPDFARLPDRELSGVLGWFEASQRRALATDRVFHLKGRTTASVMRDAERWQAQQRRVCEEMFPASGLVPHQEGVTRITEIGSLPELVEEGEEMHHCATSYRRLLRKGKVALFSLREGSRRVATIEVALGAMEVVQAKRAANRLCRPPELAVIRRWAAENRLTMALVNPS